MSATNFQKLSRDLSGSSGVFGSLLLFVIILLIAVLLYWASVTELDNVTRGQGKIISSMKNQIVQTSEAGVIKARYVEEGMKVEKDFILFEIDPIDAKTSYEQAMQRLSSLQIQEIRLAAEVLGETPVFSTELTSTSDSIVTGEKALYAARKADLNAQLAVLKQQLIQREKQIEEIKVTIDTARETLLLLQKQIDIIEPLVKSGLSPETELLALQRQAKDFEGKEEAAIARLNIVDSSIIEVEQEIYFVRSLNPAFHLFKRA